MDAKKFAALMKGLRSAYPNAKMIDSDEAMKMWYSMLSDLTYEQLSFAVQRHIATCRFAPTIAEIRELASVREEKDWSEAWGHVQDAIGRYGYYEPSKMLDYIKARDELAYKIVKSLGVRELCLSDNPTADRANFRMAYESRQKKAAERTALSPNLRAALETSGQKKLDGHYALEDDRFDEADVSKRLAIQQQEKYRKVMEEKK